MFPHYYGEQSCTAGRAAFLTGQHGIRTGLTKVGFPGAPMGMSQLDPSIGGLLKNLGYATGQFGKNHRRRPQRVAADGERLRRVLRQPLPPQRRGRAGDCRTIRRTRLTARKFGPRGVLQMQGDRQGRPDRSIRASAGSASRRSRTPARSTKKRMETIDDETSAAAIDFMKRQQAGRQAVLLLVQRHPHAPAHACARRASRQLQARRQRVHRRHDRARRHGRHAAQGARRSGHRQQHDRRLHDRQRPAHEHLAGRRA